MKTTMAEGEGGCRELLFRSDIEMVSFVWRHVAASFERRSLLPLKHRIHAERLEKTLNGDPSWRLGDWELKELCERTLNDHPEIRDSLRTLSFRVAADEECGWFSEFLGVAVARSEVDAAQAKQISQLREQLDLLLSLIALTIDQADIYSPTRLLSSICPDALPPLKRFAVRSKLNIVQALYSFVMAAKLSSEHGQQKESVTMEEDEKALAAHVGLLRRLDEAVDEMHSRMIESNDIPRFLSGMVATAAEFVLSTSPKDTRVNRAQHLLNLNIKQLAANRKNVEDLVPCGNKEADAFVSPHDRVARALLDRFTALDIWKTPEDASFTPIFKTPLAPLAVCDEPSRSHSSPIASSIDPPEATTTPQSTGPAWFMSNTTPTPTATIHEDVPDEANKENIPPGGQVIDVPSKKAYAQHDKSRILSEISIENGNDKEESMTPLRSRRGLRVLKANTAGRNSRCSLFRPSSNSDSAPAKKSRPSAKEVPNPKQPSITSFFTKKQAV